MDHLDGPLEGVIELGEGTFALPAGCLVHRTLTLRGAGAGATRLVGGLTIEGAEVRLEGVSLESVWVAVTLRDGALSMRDCSIERGEVGLLIENGRADLDGCELRGLAGTGLVWAGGGGTARRCLIERNGRDGVYVGSGAVPVLESCLLLDNGGAGIHYADHAGGEAYGNWCEGNGRGDIVMAATARPALKHNQGEVMRLPAIAVLYTAS